MKIILQFLILVTLTTIHLSIQADHKQLIHVLHFIIKTQQRHCEVLLLSGGVAAVLIFILLED